ncbi:DUF11 domain-containing protein [Spirosoma sp. KCTC 42546]|uniref:beta strand repeat-containing protein n=1 Tax=Spirosoma sp. KCTC 42546 TaxID=2520506 RepID=UPI00143DD5A4|nr:DUF11 domain-containing protein [Spirosoma sp. KCTC 42546]
MVVTPGLCQSATNSYVLSGTINATNVPTSGTLTITSAALSQPRTLTLPAANTVSGTFSYSGLIANGQIYTITASYSDGTCSPVSQTFTAPVSCSVAPICSLSATATAGICATATNTYSASVVVNLTNGVAGPITVSLPGSTPISQTLAANTGTFTAVFNGLTSDGASHTATISLPGCGTTTATFTAPASCSVTPICSMSAVATPGLCQTATNTYSSTVVVTIRNPAAGILTIIDGDQTLTFSTTANAQNTFTATFNGLLSNATTHTVTASLPDCSTTITTYTAPASCSIVPVCSLSAVVTVGLCQPATNTYSSTVVVTVQNPSTGIITIGDGTLTQTFSTTTTARNTFTVIFPGLLSTGTSHTVTASLPGCSTTNTTYTAPVSCSTTPVCALSLTASGANCNPATNLYVLSGAITLTNSPISQTLTLTDGSYVRSLTAAAGTTTINYSYTTLQSDGAIHTVTLTSSSCGTASTTYTAPASCTSAPACSVSAVASAGSCATATNTYSSTVLVTLTNPIAGTMTVADGVNSITFVVPASVGTITASAVFNGSPSDGLSHTVTVSLPGCSSTTATYTAPASCSVTPVCSVSAVVTAGSCASATNTYSATAVVTVKNPTAGVLTVSTGAQSLTFATTAASSATFTATFANLPADGVSHTITASLYGCSSTTATYTAPASCSATPVCSLSLTTTGLPIGTVGQAYSATLTATGGTAPYSFSLASGSLPAGITLNPTTGVLSGIPTNSGSFSTSIRITDSQSCSAIQPLAVLQIELAPVCSLSAVVTPGNCASATNTYSATAVVTLANPTAGVLTITNGAQSFTFATTATNSGIFTATFSGLPADGTSHTVTASLPGCSTTSTTYTAPISCSTTQVCSISAVATPGNCASATNTYSATALVTVQNPTAGILLVTTGSQSLTFATTATSSATFTAVFNGLPADGASHSLIALVLGCSTTTTYTAPVSCSAPPACLVSAVSTAGSCASATNTYSATAVVTVKNPTAGVLTVSTGAQSLTFATTAVSSGTFTATFTNLPADGVSHTVTASLPGCSTTTATYTAPASCSATPVCSMSATIVSSVCSTITPSIIGGTTPYNYNWIGPTMNVTVAAKDVTHPYLGVGFSVGYVINGVQGKELTLVRGVKYSFNVNSPGHPFEFTTSPVGGAANAGVIITAGVTNAGATSGILTFTPSATTPDLIYYNCNLHGNMGWKVNIIDQQPNGVIANAANGTYSLTVTDAANCSATTVATVNCPCSVSITSVTPSQCSAATNTYSATAVVRLSNPTAGVLTITNGAQSLTFAATATNPATFTAVFNGLIADGVSHTVTASLPGCSTTNTTYTAPASCSVAQVCSVSAVATAGVCASATNTFSTTVVVNLKNVTTAGTLSITDGPTSITFATTVASSASFAAVFTGLVSDGNSHNVTASLPGCSTITTTYTAPGSCTQPVGTKLVLDKLVNKSKAKIGDLLTYTLVLTNSGTTLATNVVVQDSMTTGLRYVVSSATAPAGTTFTQGTPTSTWKVATLSAGQSVSMTLQAIADSSGILYNKATIPGDTVTVCTSVPVIVCSGDTYLFQLTAPAGRSSYRWFNGSVEIPGQTTNVLNITAPGTYSLAVDNVSGKCPDFSCCPFIVEEDTLPTFQAQAVPVTCTGNTSQVNGKIVLSTFKTGYTYQYSLGSSFNEAAPLSGSAKVIPAGGVIVSNLTNPVVAQAYTIRVYNASGCYTDVTVMLLPNPCGCPEAVCVPLVIKQTKGVRRQGL